MDNEQFSVSLIEFDNFCFQWLKYFTFIRRNQNEILDKNMWFLFEKEKKEATIIKNQNKMIFKT